MDCGTNQSEAFANSEPTHEVETCACVSLQSGNDTTETLCREARLRWQLAEQGT